MLCVWKNKCLRKNVFLERLRLPIKKLEPLKKHAFSMIFQKEALSGAVLRKDSQKCKFCFQGNSKGAQGQCQRGPFGNSGFLGGGQRNWQAINFIVNSAMD